MCVPHFLRHSVVVYCFPAYCGQLVVCRRSLIKLFKIVLSLSFPPARGATSANLIVAPVVLFNLSQKDLYPRTGMCT